MRIRTSKEIGALIRDRRKTNGWDQATLAKRVGVSRQWIIDVEHGKPRAAIGLVLRTLDALGIVLSTDSGRRPTAVVPPPPDIDAIVEKARKHRG